MIKLIKAIAWLFLVASFAVFAWLAFGASQGQLTVTVNGEQVEGTQKLLVGSVGFLVAGFATLVALGITVLAIAGSGLLVFVALAFTALILIAIAVPFLLPLAIPIVVVAFILMLCRQSPRSKPA